jgi:hypothetical protein
MQVRDIVETDHAAIAALHDEWWGASVPRALVPDTGAVVEKDGVILGGAYLYHTNSDLCFLEHLVVRKTASARDKLRASSLLMSYLLPKDKTTYTFSQKEGYATLVKRYGFKQGETNMVSFIYSPKGEVPAALRDGD